jgi:uncharacterized membrane protein YdjX (TVP38/TMEM64 family)
MEVEALSDACQELGRWLMYTIGFTLIPFGMNALVLLLYGYPVELKTVFEIRTLLFLGIVVCGTLLERLGAFLPKRRLEQAVRALGTWLYSVSALFLAAAYALRTDPGLLSGGPPVVAAGGAVDVVILRLASLLVIALVCTGAAMYLFVHYFDFSRRIMRPHGNS